MWVKTACCNFSLSSFNKKLLFTMYWCNLILVRKLLPAEGYNLLSSCTSQSIYQYVGVSLLKAPIFTHFLAAPRRELEPLGSCTGRYFYQYIGADLLNFTIFQGPHFINFQIGSIKQSPLQYNHQLHLHHQSLNHPTLKPYQQHSHQNRQQNSAKKTRSNCNFIYHTSYYIRYSDKSNLRAYAHLPKTTRVQICKF